MGASVLHIKTEVECKVYLFDEEQGIAYPDKYYNLEVRKGEQDLHFISTANEDMQCSLLYQVEESDCDYRIRLEKSQFKNEMIELLSEVTNEELSNGIEDDFGVVYNRDGSQLLQCTNHHLKSYQVKEGCKVIRGYAFSSPFCEMDLSSINFPTSLTHIGHCAFKHCSNLLDIILPDSITYIGGGAFEDCIGLSKISMPANLTHIENCTFKGCTNLTNINIPASLTDIRDWAFEGCTGLSCITLPESLTHIGVGAFIRTNIRTIISNSPNFTFDNGCLIDVKAKKLIAFLSDKSDIELTTGLTHIGDYVFEQYSNLSNITLPKSLIYIEAGAFARTNVRTIISNSPNFVFNNGCLIDVKAQRLIAFLSDQSYIELPAGLTHIGDYAFAGCSGLQSITLPNSLTHIGNHAFMSCISLYSITLPDNLTFIGDFAFADCGFLNYVTLPGSLTHIGFGAFYINDNPSTIYIPSGMRKRFEELLPEELHDKLFEKFS